MLLTLPLALSALSFLSNSTDLLSKIESSSSFETAWNANLDLAVAMSKDPKIAEVLNPAEWKMLKDVALNLDMCTSFNRPNVSKWTIIKDIRIYLEKNVSPLVLVTVLEKIVKITSVQTIIKEYPELKVALNLTKILAIKITEDFGPKDMPPEVWKQLLVITRLEITENINKECKDVVVQNCTEFCEKLEGIKTKYPDLIKTDENELNRLFRRLVPTTAEAAIDSLHIGHLLKLPLLITSSIQILEKSISVENAVKIYQLSIKTKSQVLKKKAEKFILFEFEQISQNDENLISLKMDELFSLLVSDTLIVKEEYTVFQVISRWVQTDVTSRKVHVTALMKAVRLHLLSLSQLKFMLEHTILVEVEPVLESIRAVIVLMENEPSKLAELVKKERRHQHETLFVIGGKTKGQTSVTIETFNTHDDHWVYQSRFNNGLTSWMSAMAVGQSIVVFSQEQGKVSSFDPIKKEWTLLSDIPAKRKWFGLAELGGLIYLLGGTTTATTPKCETYDLQTNKWATIPDLNKERTAPSAAALQGKIYVAGGYDSRIEYLNTVEVLEPGTDSWTYATAMELPRSAFPLVADGNYLWAFGGYDGKSPINNVERFSPESKAWKYMPGMPSARHYHNAILFSGEFYVIGGTGLLGNTAVVQDTVDVYDPSTQSWRNASDLNFGRHSFGVCVISNLPNSADFARTDDED